MAATERYNNLRTTWEWNFSNLRRRDVIPRGLYENIVDTGVCPRVRIYCTQNVHGFNRYLTEYYLIVAYRFHPRARNEKLVLTTDTENAAL